MPMQSHTASVRQPAPDIDDLFADPAPPPPPQAREPTPPQATRDIRSAADIDDAPPAPPPRSAAFPAPAQQMDPSKVDEEAERKNDEPAVVGSVNGEDDEFDAFLNNRLGN